MAKLDKLNKKAARLEVEQIKLESKQLVLQQQRQSTDDKLMQQRENESPAKLIQQQKKLEKKQEKIQAKMERTQSKLNYVESVALKLQEGPVKDSHAVVDREPSIGDAQVLEAKASSSFDENLMLEDIAAAAVQDLVPSPMASMHDRL